MYYKNFLTAYKRKQNKDIKNKFLTTLISHYFPITYNIKLNKLRFFKIHKGKYMGTTNKYIFTNKKQHINTA